MGFRIHATANGSCYGYNNEVLSESQRFRLWIFYLLEALPLHLSVP